MQIRPMYQQMESTFDVTLLCHRINGLSRPRSGSPPDGKVRYAYKGAAAAHIIVAWRAALHP